MALGGSPTRWPPAPLPFTCNSSCLMWHRSLLPRCHLSCLEERCLGQLLTLWLGSSSTEVGGQGLDDSCPGCWAVHPSSRRPTSSCGSCPPSPACGASGTPPSTPCSRPWPRGSAWPCQPASGTGLGLGAVVPGPQRLRLGRGGQPEPGLGAQFFQVPYAALTMLLTPCPKERDSATAYRMTMEMAGTLMGAAVHGLIVSGAHGPHRCEDPALPGPVAISPDATRLYSIASAVVAVTYPVCSSLLCLGVKERPGSSVPASGPGPSFLAGLVLTVRHPPYLKLVISFLFISAAIQVEQSYLVLFCTHASRLHDHVQGVVLTILVSAVLSTPLWEWVLQRFGKKTSAFGICVMVPFAILLAAVPTAPVAYVVAFVSGMSISVSLLLPWSMLPDVVDDFQLQHQHGPGLETIFYSSYVFFSKLSGAGALGISTLSLEFAGYEAGACKQAEQVVVTLKVLIGAVPTCMILTGLCILMVSPTPKVPRQNSSRRLSLQRRTSYTLA
ncbi:sphingosine-1-phosphate transporter MFSD2B isoform X2 [Acinonyx jubatus]|uniref:Sphingosine-1-phosphate transporter MFSD2B isoform X2 n=1 Tax=Acinonyx jubatus TaxID=32536 RepID=A0ABM3NCJ8_ACIJB|nr:sphingosine-1-phosphate transporter MFSD2B isoform X2 [Acinonyx jubatus]